MRTRQKYTRRPGTTTVESALVFGVFLLLVLGTLDLGIGVLRYHLVSGAARQGARQAIVHGTLATELGTWGPSPLGPLGGNDSAPLAQAVRPYLTGIDPSTVSISAQWLDGGTDPDQRVQVTVSVPYRPILSALLGLGPLTLRACSTMPIVH